MYQSIFLPTTEATRGSLYRLTRCHNPFGLDFIILHDRGYQGVDIQSSLVIGR